MSFMDMVVYQMLQIWFLNSKMQSVKSNLKILNKFYKQFKKFYKHLKFLSIHQVTVCNLLLREQPGLKLSNKLLLIVKKDLLEWSDYLKILKQSYKMLKLSNPILELTISWLVTNLEILSEFMFSDLNKNKFY